MGLLDFLKKGGKKKVAKKKVSTPVSEYPKTLHFVRFVSVTANQKHFEGTDVVVNSKEEEELCLGAVKSSYGDVLA